ncbi:hypothetical protein [Actinophytocola sp.]|uniref:hypothetical protein n=1 Tax=Actinophytocola sp. TaxID=1872138 RepID=UPI002D60D6EE|nr:hypothetical protein [Actinophytocola sp.]HYQ62538.1 hypothetical protein [Actinophytocola sp.]
MHPTVAANAQHRLDDATGKWKRVRAGVYENFEGWKITKTPDGYRWQVLNPAGDVVTKWSEPTLTWAKIAAEKLIAEAAEQPAPAEPVQVDEPADTRTPRQIACAAAETCTDALHQHLYGDDAPRGLEKHTNAHEAERDGYQPCATCGLAVQLAKGTKHGYAHVDRDTFISNWPHHDTVSAPSAIDAQLENLWADVVKARQLFSSAADLARIVTGERKVYRGNRRVYASTETEALDALQARLNENTISSHEVERARRALARAAEAVEADKQARAAIEPLDELYDARPWSRFFTVPGGHIHFGMRCKGGTIRVRTQLAWNTVLSGQVERDAVDHLGPHLCSHCFPSAPVEWQRDPADKPADPDQCTDLELTDAQRAKVNPRRISNYVRCSCTADVSVTPNGRKRKHKRGDLPKTKK